MTIDYAKPTRRGPNVNVNANATPTFAVFATGSGAVPFVPQTNRIFLEFSDAGITVRGLTSPASRRNDRAKPKQ